ncbi:hypothetical protein [Spiroplasma endosymbiont of Atherix ibis]|uniref:hypothetical protein n=1 Tax=Spiroplasma endosymbiont of Atherix ibis TaxID=3066291 RepID=UPI0030D0297C
MKKIVKTIREKLINNQKLNKKEINDLEVFNSKNNSKTLLKDYSSLELAIEDLIKRELLLEFNKIWNVIFNEKDCRNYENYINKI